MSTKKLISKIIPWVLLLIFCDACRFFNKETDVEGLGLDISIHRFEKDLYAMQFDSIEDYIPPMREKYPVFFEIFNEYILGIGNSFSKAYPDLLLDFLAHYSVQTGYRESMELYANIDEIEHDLTKAFANYIHYFPEKKVPAVYTYIGGFRQHVIIGDSLLAIGLDNYLGVDNEVYDRLGIFDYLKKNMHRDKIVPDCIYLNLQNDFIYNDENDNVLNQMIYIGKLLYATDQILPDVPDSLIIGFTEKQMAFCEENEEKIWLYLVEYKKLFSSDKMDISKLINEGPFTNDFTNESPARAVTWIGWRIVERYMKKNKVSLKELMEDDNYMEIYNRARYSP